MSFYLGIGLGIFLILLIRESDESDSVILSAALAILVMAIWPLVLYWEIRDK